MCARAHSRASSSVDPDEVKRFAALSGKWWDPQGAFSALHRMNPVRAEFIISAVRGNITRADTSSVGHSPLRGLRILDVGCGGGLLCEPLARLGANVVGVDATRENIEAAKRHARESPDICGRLDYVHTTVEDHVADTATAYDVVVRISPYTCLQTHSTQHAHTQTHRHTDTHTHTQTHTHTHTDTDTHAHAHAHTHTTQREREMRTDQRLMGLLASLTHFRCWGASDCIRGG